MLRVNDRANVFGAIRFASLATILVILFCPSLGYSYRLQLREQERDLSGIADSDPEVFRKAKDLGVKVLVVEGRKPFLAYWVPENFKALSQRRVLVVMHGTNGNAYRHLLNYLEVAKKRQFALLSVQWGWPGQGRNVRGKERYTYIRDPRQSYKLISAGLRYLDTRYAIDKEKCAWLGFSRSSTQCIIFAHLDKNEGENYFRLFIAVSGGAGPNMPLMRELLSGRYGSQPIRDQHFYLWAGRQDRGRQESMRQTQAFIEQLGGVVERFTVGPEGHGGFNHNLNYQLEAVRVWFSLCASSPEVYGGQTSIFNFICQ